MTHSHLLHGPPSFWEALSSPRQLFLPLNFGSWLPFSPIPAQLLEMSPQQPPGLGWNPSIHLELQLKRWNDLTTSFKKIKDIGELGIIFRF